MFLARRCQQAQHVRRACGQQRDGLAEIEHGQQRIRLKGKQRSVRTCHVVGGVRIHDDVARDGLVVANKKWKVQHHIRETHPRDVAPLGASEVEQRILELPVQISDEHGVLLIHAQGQAGDERLGSPIVMPIDRRPGVPAAPAGIEEHRNDCDDRRHPRT